MDTPDENAQRDASAEALRSLADRQGGGGDPSGSRDGGEAPADDAARRDPADALHAMADGEDLAAAPVGDTEPETPGEEPDAADADALEGLPGRGEARSARRARSATIGAQADSAHHHQFHRAMIPLLVVVGILLFVLGFVVAILGPARAETSMFGGTMTTVAVVVAFPLGAILLFGAWFFRREVARADRDRS
ncbi:MAG: hypothetical protein ACOC8F_02620 [Planctomycetota bacterium]